MKKKILAIWYYHRLDLTKHLLELSGEAQIVFLDEFAPSKEKSQSDLNGKNISIIYWEDYKSPYQLLDDVNPDLVVFYDIEAFNQIALNIAARNRGITTYMLQHGLRGSYEIDDALRSAETKTILELSNTSMWTFKFLLKSLQWKNWRSLAPLLKFIIARKRFGLTIALYKNQFELRRADKYIEFSKENASYYKLRDGISDDRFILIGNPQYDDFFQRIKHIQIDDEQPYALLIDTPFCEAVFEQKIRMSQEEKNGYLSRLNEICKNKKLKFYVKLHPLSYKTNDLYKDENITYFHDADIVQLIGGAQFVFLVHLSTLAPLVLLKKHFYFFKNKYIQLNKFVLSLPIAIHDLLNFDSEDLLEQEPHPPLDEQIIEDYLFVPDGQANQRLKKVLLS